MCYSLQFKYPSIESWREIAANISYFFPQLSLNPPSLLLNLLDRIDFAGHKMKSRPLFWMGLGLILTGVLVLIVMVISWEMHKKDDTGTSGGFDGIEIFIWPPLFSITFIVTGIYCMICMRTVFCLIILSILNIISALVHIWCILNGTGWQTPSPNASEAIIRRSKTAWMRILPETLGIILSLAAVGAASCEAFLLRNLKVKD